MYWRYQMVLHLLHLAPGQEDLYHSHPSCPTNPSSRTRLWHLGTEVCCVFWDLWVTGVL